MIRYPMMAGLAGALSLLALSSGADVWDVQTLTDDQPASQNRLRHGTNQTHDLGVRPGPVADQDWYFMAQQVHRSYEVSLDDVSSDSGAVHLERLTQDGSMVLQSANTPPHRLAWMAGGPTPDPVRIRVLNAICATACGPDDVYTIRARDTTIGVPRWNASGTQTTILVIQSVSAAGAEVRVTFWRNGLPLHTEQIGLKGEDVYLMNVSSIPEVVGLSGHATIAHTGGYGGLNVKAVALEPATGFTFDTQGAYIPY